MTPKNCGVNRKDWEAEIHPHTNFRCIVVKQHNYRGNWCGGKRSNAKKRTKFPKLSA
jgi:hypothetical protein